MSTITAIFFVLAVLLGILLCVVIFTLWKFFRKDNEKRDGFGSLVHDNATQKLMFDAIPSITIEEELPQVHDRNYIDLESDLKRSFLAKPRIVNRTSSTKRLKRETFDDPPQFLSTNRNLAHHPLRITRSETDISNLKNIDFRSLSKSPRLSARNSLNIGSTDEIEIKSDVEYSDTEDTSIRYNEDNNYLDNFVGKKKSMKRSKSFRKSGKICFSTHYVSEKEVLQVCIKRATELGKGRNDVDINPFVKLYLQPFKSQKYETRCQKETKEPFFNEMFLFKNLPKNIIASFVLHLEVMNYQGMMKTSSSLGNASIALSSLVVDQEQQFNLDLMKKVKRDYKSELLLTIRYNSVECKLHVQVVEARNLPKPNKNGIPMPYVVINLTSPNEYDQTKNTHKLERSRNPRFSESLTFDLPKRSNKQLDDYMLTATMKDSCRVKSDEVIGYVTLSSTAATAEARDHWLRIQDDKGLYHSQWHILKE